MEKKSLDKFITHIQTCCDKLILKYKHLIQKENPIIFDVGSNIGVFTKSFIKYKPNGSYHLFEPVSKYFEISKKYLNNNSNIYFNNMGLSNKNENKIIYVDNYDSSIKRNINNKPWCNKCKRRCGKCDPEIIINHGWNTYIKEKKHDDMSEIETKLIR